MRLCALQINWHPKTGEWLGAAWKAEGTGKYVQSRVELVGDLRQHARSGYTLLAYGADQHVFDALWKAGEHATLHFYETVFNRARWRFQDKQYAEVWDARNLAAGLSLEEIGEGIGLPTYPEPYRLVEPDDPRQGRWQCTRHGEWECIPCYVIRKAEIIWRFASSLGNFMESCNLRMKRTVGGNAVALWQYFDHGASQNLRGPLIVQMAREAYHGARNEPYRIGLVEGVHTYDVRAHYAAVMRDAPMPDLHGLTYVEKPTMRPLDNLYGVVEATVRVPATHIPPLPAVGPDGQLYFPVGTFRGTWVIPELVNAVQRGVEIMELHRIAYTKRTVYPFRTFVNVVLELRREWERDLNPLAFWCKMLPNGLYGRLGVRESQAYRTYSRSDRTLTPKDIDGKDVLWFDDLRTIIGDYQIRMKSEIQNVLWAATITAYGRMRLLAFMEQAGTSLIYCDCDSVFSSQPLPVGSGLAGELRDTGHFRKGIILGPKLYRLEGGDTPDMVAARGIPKQLAMAFIESGKVEFPQPFSLAVAVDQHRAPGQWGQAVRNHRNVATKRTVLDPNALLYGGHSGTVPVSFSLDSLDLTRSETAR